jgi:hypothetical protein
LVVVTGLVQPELVETLVQLKAVGRRVVLISLDREEPPAEDLPGIPWYHLPMGQQGADGQGATEPIGMDAPVQEVA